MSDIKFDGETVIIEGERLNIEGVVTVANTLNVGSFDVTSTLSQLLAELDKTKAELATTRTDLDNARTDIEVLVNWIVELALVEGGRIQLPAGAVEKLRRAQHGVVQDRVSALRGALQRH